MTCMDSIAWNAFDAMLRGLPVIGVLPAAKKVRAVSSE